MKKSILLIDDEDHVRQTVILTLTATNTAQNGMAKLIGNAVQEDENIVTVIEAESGELGVEIFREKLEQNQTPDLLIIDMRMGDGIDGMETIRRIREIDRKTPIVIYSGWVDFSLEDIKRVNGDAFIEIVTKPRIRELFQQVNRILF